MKIITFIKNWTLPLAMIVGAAGFPLLIHFSPLTPFLIFSMLFLTFCRVPLSSIHFRMLHIWLLVLQTGGAIAAYYVLAPFNVLVAEGTMVCIMTPTATAAAVITQRLGGSAASLTGYTLLSNLAAAVAIPIFFPAVHPMSGGLTFLAAFWTLLQKVVLLLVAPFVTAVCLHRFFPRIHARVAKKHELSFYLWAVALMIIMAQATHTVVYEPAEGLTEIWIALGALAACCLQFFLGKRIGAFYNGRITGGQALGQKNTILAVWLAHTYMTPITAVGAGSYVLWQNIINSWQLWRQRKDEENGIVRKNEPD